MEAILKGPLGHVLAVGGVFCTGRRRGQRLFIVDVALLKTKNDGITCLYDGYRHRRAR